MNLSKQFSKENMNRRQEKLFEVVKFLSKLVFTGLIFQAILYIYPDTNSAQAFLAQIIAVLVDPLMKASFTASGIDVLTDGVRYIITQDCLGWKSMAAFTALIFASTERYRKNLKYVFGGLVVIFLANIVRIVTTIYLSHTGIISFEIIHDTLWKWSLTGLVLLLWVLWFEKLQYVENPISEFKAFLKKKVLEELKE